MRERSVGVGVGTTALVLATLVVYRSLPGHAPLPAQYFFPCLGGALVGTFAVALLPWAKLLRSKVGLAVFYTWSVVDIVLITVLVSISGAGDSPLWALYLLTIVFFASSYPLPAQLSLLGLTVAAYGISVHIAGGGAPEATLFLHMAILGVGWLLAAFLSRELQGAMAAHDRARQEAAERADALLDSLDALEQAHVQLIEQERMAAIGQTAAAVAHELRNPLGVVNNVFFLLEQQLPAPDGRARSHLQTAIREVGTASRVVSDLLEFARPRAALPQAVDVRTVVEQTIGALPAPVGVTVVTDLAPDLPAVLADQEHLVHALRNVLANAYDAAEGHGDVRVAARETDATVTLTVQDDGDGISAEAAEGLFRPFFTTKTRGIGLGLVVASRLVRGQGGRLTVDSTPHRGTTVAIAVPTYEDVAIPDQPVGVWQPVAP